MSIGATELVEMAKALGHQARLRVLAMLREGPLCVCQVTSVLGLASSTVSEHLSELRRAGWVFEEKRGKWVFYQLTETDPLRQLAQTILQLVEGDPQLRADAEVIRALRAVPVDELCRAGLDLVAVGVKRGRSATAGELSDSGSVGGDSQ